MYTRILSIVLGVTLLPLLAYAQVDSDTSPIDTETQNAISSFKNMKGINAPNIVVPTVVEIPFEQSELESKIFGVYNTSLKKFEPYYYRADGEVDKANISVRNGTRTLSPMSDNRYDTYTDFPASLDGTVVETTFSLYTSKNGVDANVDATGLSISLAAHVSYPLTVKITATPKGGSEQVVVTQKAFPGRIIRFPETSAQEWTVTFTHSQPLRISEVSLVENNVEKNYERAVRFLAQPGVAYTVFYNADRYENLNSGEIPNLRDDEGVLELSYVGGSQNTAYKEADVDDDGIPDTRDNCVNVANPDQLDVNGNRRGDACDDFDKDGRVNSIDNCPNEPNRAQRDEDGDGIGDACDGEESRLTERHTWIPWAGMGLAALVLFALFGVTISSMKKKKEEEIVDSEDVVNAHSQENEEQLEEPNTEENNGINS